MISSLASKREARSLILRRGSEISQAFLVSTISRLQGGCAGGVWAWVFGGLRSEPQKVGTWLPNA